jgi:hypothetical protein
MADGKRMLPFILTAAKPHPLLQATCYTPSTKARQSPKRRPWTRLPLIETSGWSRDEQGGRSPFLFNLVHRVCLVGSSPVYGRV